jgi:ankyrin repeat protein
MLKAIKDNDLQHFKECLERYIPYDGFNILHETICRQRFEMSSMIVRAFPSLAEGRDYPAGYTPIMYAIKVGDMRSVRIFDGMENAYSTTNNDGDTPLHVAIAYLDLDDIKHVLQQFPQALHSVNTAGHTPLHVASMHGAHVDVLRLLCEQNREINIPDHNGNYPIHRYGDVNEYSRFEDAGPNAESLTFLASLDTDILLKKNKKGNLPIHELAVLFAPSNSKLLQQIYAVVDMRPETLLVRNNFGELPIHICGFYHDVGLISKNLQVYPHLLYETTPDSLTILDMFSRASNKTKGDLVISVIKSKSQLLDAFWSFIPTPLPGLENHMCDMNRETRGKLIHFLTRETKRLLKDRYYMLESFYSSRNITMERDVADTILWRSIMHGDT